MVDRAVLEHMLFGSGGNYDVDAYTGPQLQEWEFRVIKHLMEWADNVSDGPVSS